MEVRFEITFEKWAMRMLQATASAKVLRICGLKKFLRADEKAILYLIHSVEDLAKRITLHNMQSRT